MKRLGRQTPLRAVGASEVCSVRWPAPSSDASRIVAEEVAVAIVHDGSTTAVLMATPCDLEDLAVGFSLTEGLIERLDDLTGLETVQAELGFETRVWLAREQSVRLAARRRRVAGPTGCGLCGVDSLAEAVKPPPTVRADLRIAPSELLAAMQAMAEQQSLGQTTRAAHAAAFWRGGKLSAIREDVGRHNALDKLIGALVQSGEPCDGVVLLTSRVSVEMVQKTAAFGAPVLCAVSAPTALAIRTAEAAGITLVAVCRADGFEIFSHPGRIGVE